MMSETITFETSRNMEMLLLLLIKTDNILDNVRDLAAKLASLY